MAPGVGLIPEQAWELPDLPRVAVRDRPDDGVDRLRQRRAGRLGRGLTWSAAQFVRLMLDLGAGAARPPGLHRRPLRHAHPGHHAADRDRARRPSPVAGSPTVTGTSGAGQHGRRRRGQHRRRHRHHDRDRHRGGRTAAFSIDVPLTGGTTVLNIVATSRQRRHRARRAHGRLRLRARHAAVRRRRPGRRRQRARATTPIRRPSNFKPGAYDLQRFEVYDAGDRSSSASAPRDLTPTFGSPLGAQLVDVYVHDPGARADLDRGVVPAAQLHHRAGRRWSRLIEVQGFGQQYVDAGGATLGQVTISANDVSRYITFSVTKASLGTPGPGWGFTVVLTGQDGFSPDQARGFQPTPQDFQFGVCADREPRPALHRRPGTVPRRWTSSRRPASPRPTSSTTRCTSR